MMRLWFVMGLLGILILGSVTAAEKLSDFEAKAPDVAEKTGPAVASGALKELQEAFKESRIAVRFLTDGAYTAKFVNAKDEKDYFLTAVPIVSHFPQAAPPLAVLIVSDGKEFGAGWLRTGRNRRNQLTCELLTSGGELIARARKIETLREPPLPVERGKAAVAIAKNPEKDDMILVLCRSPYPAKKEGERECTAVIFYSGDLAWDKFAPPGKEEGE